ncbi:hypothetical protein AQUCO_00600076v1 [Aquilegia coerulea]|uniref:Uncharacterized protein n=1 Tax=Aquilegia coerulea TaxID=218851 RepID=A0A2G5EMW6_AQUCA|nr:hypothetical protein AQUCO_00600076v1 [Aquilegia coerulea]
MAKLDSRTLGHHHFTHQQPVLCQLFYKGYRVIMWDLIDNHMIFFARGYEKSIRGTEYDYVQVFWHIIRHK